MRIDFANSGTVITLRPRGEKPGLLARLVGASPKDASFSALPDSEQALIFALGDLRALEDATPGAVTIDHNEIRITHDAAAALSAASAQALGLPEDVHLTLSTDVVGTLGSPDFRLTYEWRHQGQRQSPKREGCLLFTGQGARRLPHWLKRALDLADGFSATASLDEHWAALAKFRQALEPDEVIPSSLSEGARAARVAMTSFLRGLQVRLADRFSIRPDAVMGQFDVLPFSGARFERDGIGDDTVSEADAELSGELLDAFQFKLHTRGASPAYQLGANFYLVIDRSAAPILAEMVRVQRAPKAEREAFIKNPRAFITRSVTEELNASGELNALSPAEQEERIENVVGPGLVETREYSERVMGVAVYTKPSRPGEPSGTTWLPEFFPVGVQQALEAMSLEALGDLGHQMEQRVAEPGATVTIAGEEVEVTPERVASVNALREGKIQESQDNSQPSDAAREKTGPLILAPEDNYEEVTWSATLMPRAPLVEIGVSPSIRTTLKEVVGFLYTALRCR